MVSHVQSVSSTDTSEPKVSSINLETMDVFPTPGSPRIRSLMLKLKGSSATAIVI